MAGSLQHSEVLRGLGSVTLVPSGATPELKLEHQAAVTVPSAGVKPETPSSGHG